MKLLSRLKKLTSITFSLLTIAVAILIFVYSQRQTVETKPRNDLAIAATNSELEVNKLEGYELPLLNSHKPIPVYPQINSNASLLVRKNVVDLTSEEKAAFVNAIKNLKNTIPENSKISIYDQFVLEHVLVAGFEKKFAGAGPTDGFNPTHGMPAFLPWHRQFLNQFEKALQKIDPSVTIPYWDWTDPKALDIILEDNFLGPNGQGVKFEIPGLGTIEGGPVETGLFADWTLNEEINIEQINKSSLGTKLTRFVKMPPFDKYPLSKTAVNKLFTVDDYLIFNAMIEGIRSIDPQGQLIEDWILHGYGHGIIGGALVKDIHKPPILSNQIKILGTMNSLPSSPYDPIFWLHHANVDRLWAEWQDWGHSGSNFYPVEGMPYGHNLKDPMWPWDDNQSRPGNISNTDLVSLLPSPVSSDVIAPINVLDFRKMGYTYDTLDPYNH